jgi:hypothetical protein
MSEVQASSRIVIKGPFQIAQEHSLPSKFLLDARDAFESAGVKFGADMITDEIVRRRYVEGIKRVSQLIQVEVDSGKMAAYEGASYCNRLGNQILGETRKVTSAWGRSIVERIKPMGPSLNELLDKYSYKEFDKSFSALSPTGKSEASYKVVISAGRNDTNFTFGTMAAKYAGATMILLTGALAAYRILESNDRVTEAARQGTVIQGGVLGGYLAGLGIASLCGPGAPICALAVVLIGTGAGAMVTEYGFSAYQIKIKELQEWGIQ